MLSKYLENKNSRFLFFIGVPGKGVFGTFKDLAEYKSFDNLRDVTKEVDRVIYEYNRYQWCFKKMTPEQFRGNLLAA